jgi:hypothetical protein
VAIGAASVPHLDRKLITMGVVVAAHATLRPELQVVSGSFALVTARASDRLVFAVQRELSAAVLLHGEQCRPKSVLVMTTRAVGGSEAASMHVSVAIGTLLKLQASISPLHRELG